MQTTVCLDFMGEDFVAIIEFRVTFRGHSGSYYEPPEGPEWETESIHLARDLPGPTQGPEFEATGALFTCLDNDYRIMEAISNAIAHYEPESDYD